MSAKGLECSESDIKSNKTESNATTNSKKLENRRRIEELYEEKKLREDLGSVDIYDV